MFIYITEIGEKTPLNSLCNLSLKIIYIEYGSVLFNQEKAIVFFLNSDFHSTFKTANKAFFSVQRI